ncbi:MAG: hypothetical protein ABSG74_10470 [Candidatus Bathyarchaeia archaeon]
MSDEKPQIKVNVINPTHAMLVSSESGLSRRLKNILRRDAAV